MNLFLQLYFHANKSSKYSEISMFLNIWSIHVIFSWYKPDKKIEQIFNLVATHSQKSMHIIHGNFCSRIS